jgi:hypothetical protein
VISSEVAEQLTKVSLQSRYMAQDLNTRHPDHKEHMSVEQLRDGIYRVSQEESPLFWEVTVSVITSNVYVHVSYSERFPR